MTVRVGTHTQAYAKRVRHLRSPGGIQAWLVEDHTLPILSARFGLRGGPVLDPEGRAGTARMLANLLVEGAGGMDGGTFRRALGDRGSRLWFQVGPDSLRGTLKTLAREAEGSFDLLGLALREPLLTEGDIERVREGGASDVRAALNRPDSIAYRTFAARGFAGHAYARPVTGDLDTLERIGRGTIVALHARTATRDNLRIGVVGAIGPERLCAALDRAFGALPAGAVDPTPATALGGLGERVVTRLDLPQSTIRFGRPGLPRHDPDFMATVVVNHCLGGGAFTSRLFREVRERRGLCYAVGTGLQVADGACTLIGGTSTRNDRVTETLAVIEGEIRAFAREGLGDAELEAAKGFLIGSHGLGLDTSEAIAGQLLGLQLDGRDSTWLDARNRQVAAVTRMDAARALDRLIGDGGLLVTVAGDPTGL